MPLVDDNDVSLVVPEWYEGTVLLSAPIMPMELLTPPRLTPGDTIGIVSPSGPVLPELRPQFFAGVRALEQFGVHVIWNDAVFAHDHYSAGNVRTRVDDFHAMWSNPDVRMVMMSQGGFTAIDLVPHLDYELFRRFPKIVTGTSDATTLLNVICARSKIVTYHGADLLWTMGRGMSPSCRADFVDAFFAGTERILTPSLTWRHLEREIPYPGRVAVRPGIGEGELLGGNIASLVNLRAAGYLPNPDGSILFLEGIGDTGRLHGWAASLVAGGFFDRISGLIIGWFEGGAVPGSDLHRPTADLFRELLEKYDFPILEIPELGHNVENFIFPVGAWGRVDTNAATITISSGPSHTEQRVPPLGD